MLLNTSRCYAHIVMSASEIVACAKPIKFVQKDVTSYVTGRKKIRRENSSAAT